MAAFSKLEFLNMLLAWLCDPSISESQFHYYFQKSPNKTHNPLRGEWSCTKFKLVVL
jgi:hypothetical protein